MSNHVVRCFPHPICQMLLPVMSSSRWILLCVQCKRSVCVRDKQKKDETKIKWKQWFQFDVNLTEWIFFCESLQISIKCATHFGFLAFFLLSDITQLLKCYECVWHRIAIKLYKLMNIFLLLLRQKTETLSTRHFWFYDAAKNRTRIKL